MDNALDPAMMGQFTGSTVWYRHSIARSVSHTEGVQYVAETVGAFWLIDEIALNQMDAKVRAEEFQVWELKVKDSRAVLTCGDGNGLTVWRKEITFTDFPEPGITLWFAAGVIYLPSEH